MVFKIFRKIVVGVTIGIAVGVAWYYKSELHDLSLPPEIVIQESETLGENLTDTTENIANEIIHKLPKTIQLDTRKIHGVLLIGFVIIVTICFYKSKPTPIPDYIIFGGLKNNSNFCYMNSMIQAVASNEELLKDLERIKDEITVNKENNTQLYLFIDLLQTINEPGSNANENTNKLELLMDQINWTKPDQQDAYELLAFLINTIEKSIKFHKKIAMPLKLEMMHAFSGINIPNKTQLHLGLSIGLCGEYNKSPGVTLNYLIDQYFVPTIIDDDPNKTSNLLFSGHPPNLLLLHIQANKWSSERGEMVKPVYQIRYGKCLEFNAKCYNYEKSKQEDVNVKYKLTAIVHHMGTISGGHYVTYRKWRDNWYLVNDEQVSLVDFNCEICPYILLYEKF